MHRFFLLARFFFHTNSSHTLFLSFLLILLAGIRELVSGKLAELKRLVFTTNGVMKMNLSKAKRLVAICLDAPVNATLYERADKLTSSQTHHGIDHAFKVLDLAKVVTDELHQRHPGLLDDWTRHVVIPLAAFYHDIGRGLVERGHAKAGAEWVMNRLPGFQIDGESFPMDVIKRIARIIVRHQSNTVAKMEFDDPAWAVVVFCDKCEGDEARVRYWKRLVLRVATALGIPHIPLRFEGSEHDRVNYAIKGWDVVFQDTTFQLDLQIDLRVCQPELILNTFKSRYEAAAKAAQYLGYKFEVAFNGQPFLVKPS